ncbi:DUF5993 family protein [Martelella sp. FLE1502]
MMALPFFIGAAALYLAARDRQGAAVAVTILGVVTVLVLYRFHATDTLDIGL